ncbi:MULTISPECIES: hypothetical protein [Clostridia]|uniref:Uncharacterized protein n=1 Tax=Clostridium tertium TaxID=1559 RepID=A0A9X4B4W2_9CLOT|nr:MULTISPECIES: hypothetical protein [Clostridia]MDC4242633.1 hypothetical protein [Clostridium tertium]
MNVKFDSFFNKPKSITREKRESINEIKNITKDIRKMCIILSEDSNEFDENSVKEFTKILGAYIKKYNRILYAVISDYIFSLDIKRVDTMITNLDSVLEFVLSNKYENYFKTSFKVREYKDYEFLISFMNEQEIKEKIVSEEVSKVRKSVFKIYDHVNLARYQLIKLKQDDDEFKIKFTANIKEVKLDINKELNDFMSNMNIQLISMIGIFTALAFLVFGGINSLDNIFQGAKEIPILQIMIIGSIWGLCIGNLIFVFMFFISKMTGKNIKSCQNEESNLIQKYPLVFWSNLVITTILLLSLWLYYINSTNIGEWFVDISNQYPFIFFTVGFIFIIIFFVISAFIIIKKNKKTYLNNNEFKNIEG